MRAPTPHVVGREELHSASAVLLRPVHLIFALACLRCRGCSTGLAVVGSCCAIAFGSGSRMEPSFGIGSQGKIGGCAWRSSEVLQAERARLNRPPQSAERCRPRAASRAALAAPHTSLQPVPCCNAKPLPARCYRQRLSASPLGVFVTTGSPRPLLPLLHSCSCLWHSGPHPGAALRRACVGPVQREPLRHVLAQPASWKAAGCRRCQRRRRSRRVFAALFECWLCRRRCQGATCHMPATFLTAGAAARLVCRQGTAARDGLRGSSEGGPCAGHRTRRQHSPGHCARARW